MNKNEAMKLALEALELYQSKMSVDMFDVAITALRQALEQPEQPCDMGVMCLGCTPRNPDGSCPDAADIRERMK